MGLLIMLTVQKNQNSGDLRQTRILFLEQITLFYTFLP